MIFTDGWLSQLALIFAGGGSAGAGFYMLRWLVEWIAGRLDKRQAQLDQGREALDQQWKAYRLVLEDKVERQDKRIAALEDEIAECTKKHAEAEARLIRFEAFMQGEGNARALAQGIVSAERAADRKGEA